MEKNISFFKSNKLTCPACVGEVKTEVLRQGKGINSVSLCDDLRRDYGPTKKYGLVYPAIYDIFVCNHCWFASLEKDFHEKAFDFSKINSFSKQRKLYAQILIKNHPLDFDHSRNLYTGLISYYLATHCYNFYNQDNTIDFYKGLFSLRGSWCAQDLARTENDDDFMITSLYFRYLAALGYENFISYVEKKTINENIPFFGPDTDYDFGFKGAVYLSVFLGTEFSELIYDNKDAFIFYRKLLLRLSRVFGLGKKSKKSPTPFLNKVYDLYFVIKERNKKLYSELGIVEEELEGILD